MINIYKNVVLTISSFILLGLSSIFVKSIFDATLVSAISDPISGPISGPVTPTPTATPTSVPTSTPMASTTPSPTPSATPSGNPDDGDRALGHVELLVSNMETDIDFNVRETRGTNKAHGYFRYKVDDNDIKYRAEIACVRIMGDAAWFEGPITRASNPAWEGQWIFGKAQDLSENGEGIDKVWETIVSSDPTCTRTNGMSTPAGGSFVITDGEVKVKDK